jgi:peptide/nickel transport system substrate-binding protein
VSKKTPIINLFLVLVMLLTLVSAASAAPPAQEELTYTVKLGDNLWTLAEKYLGTGPAYWVIVGATNAKNEQDSSFAYVENPSLIHPGWKLLIPSAEAAEAYLAIAKAVPSAGKTGLRVTFAWPTYIDPAVGSDFSSTSSLCNLYDTLVFPNTAGGVDAHLAESWDVSDDGLTWTFHLKKGVKFHNGSELTASDVAFSMNRLLEIGEGLAYVFLGTVEGATAPDDYTVEFKLAQPSGLFLVSLIRLYVADQEEVMANVVTPGPYGDKGDYGKEYLLTHDAGSGPYKVKEFPLEEYLLMEKYDDWFGTFSPNAPDEVRFIATTEAATVRTLMSRHELEITDQWQTIEALEALDAMGGVDVSAFPVLTEFYYMIHTQNPPTDDVHFRRAMAYAFDYDAAVALEWPGTKQSRGPVPAITAGHNPDVFVFERDLDKAREELALSAYADELDAYPVEVHWCTEVPHEEKFALLFQANMAEVGIKVNIVSTPWMSMVEEGATLETSPHIQTTYVSADFPEAGSLLKVRYHSDAAPTWSQNEWLLDDELDQMVDEALVTVDEEERYATYRELQDYIVDLCPSIFLYDQVQKHAYQSAYVDWPAARGEVIPVMGYTMFAATIGVSGP